MAELYDRYGRLVYALILRVVRDGGIAEDLLLKLVAMALDREDDVVALKSRIVDHGHAVAVRPEANGVARRAELH